MERMARHLRQVEPAGPAEPAARKIPPQAAVLLVGVALQHLEAWTLVFLASHTSQALPQATQFSPGTCKTALVLLDAVAVVVAVAVAAAAAAAAVVAVVAAEDVVDDEGISHSCAVGAPQGQGLWWLRRMTRASHAARGCGAMAQTQVGYEEMAQ
mmetsp:Transcript_142805/g.372028  ORF Transcript_142805/g.372028 Transcript_142805/m.372028 type:complete len:155 (-) Transcript_142805:191-655(-)